jgi:peptide deformylase
MALEVLTYGDPVLRKRAKPVKRIDKEVRRFLDEMAEALEEEEGLGLAAPQVGVPLRLVVCRVEEEVQRLVNPRLVWQSGERVSEVEGCLSLPGLRAEVERPAAVRVSALDEKGKKVSLAAEGLLARCLCHEADHLSGRLFVDLCKPDTVHWLVRVEAENEEDTFLYERRYTTLEEALDFLLKLRERRHGPQEM